MVDSESESGPRESLHSPDELDSLVDTVVKQDFHSTRPWLHKAAAPKTLTKGTRGFARHGKEAAAFRHTVAMKEHEEIHGRCDH